MVSACTNRGTPREKILDPRPFDEIRGQGDQANDPDAWERRGRLRAEKSLAEWPFIDPEDVAFAANCFVIANALRQGPST